MATTKGPSLGQASCDFRSGADMACIKLPATAPAQPAPTDGKKQILRDAADLARSGALQPPPGSCEQVLQLSFFFDGTGNNLDADVGTNEHSNVARLYLTHMLDDEDKQVYRFYIPGLGTYFREIGDMGDWRGKGFGYMGQDRLDWALKRFDEKVAKTAARANNMSNRIRQIRLAVFGFSRGAASARAFCREIERRCEKTDGGYRLKAGGHPVEIAFLGLFDTVASVGNVTSLNNLRRHKAARATLDAFRLIGEAEAAPWVAPAPRHQPEDQELFQLAFGEPGVDPAPGPNDGHATWAKDLAVRGLVRQCVHMVAAHEVRNSFPVDSVLHGARYPDCVIEMVYPGAHSDVGGGYRPGEQGRYPHHGEMLNLIPLRAMHRYAKEARIPLHSLTAMPGDQQETDFALDPEGAKRYQVLHERFTHYMNAAGWGGAGLGADILSHMKLYWRYRFQAIRRTQQQNGEGWTTPQQSAIQSNEKSYSAERAQQQKRVDEKWREVQRAQAAHNRTLDRIADAKSFRYRFGPPIDPKLTADEQAAKARVAAARDAYNRERAKLDTAPDDSEYLKAQDKYDRQLLNDARTIRTWSAQRPRLKLRPHYRALVEAYEDEYVNNRGLRDEKIIAFFNHYVHDSLAGFDTDQTWASDPRVVYIGGDTKLLYAQSDMDERGVA